MDEGGMNVKVYVEKGSVRGLIRVVGGKDFSKDY